VCDGRVGARRHRRGMRLMRTWSELLQCSLERRLLHHFQAAQQGCLTLFARRNVEPRRIGKDGGEVRSHERGPVPGLLLAGRYEAGVEIQAQRRRIRSGSQADPAGFDLRQEARPQTFEERMGLRDGDRLCEREPKLEAIDARDGNRRGGKRQFGLHAVPDSRQEFPARRPRQLDHHRAHLVRGFAQYRWLCVSCVVL